MDGFLVPIEEILRKYKTDIKMGLSTKQVQELCSLYGKNQLRESKKKSFLSRFIAEFKDVMIIILLIASLMSFVVAILEGKIRELTEPVLIVLIVIINAILGVVQEGRAQRSLEALKKMSAQNARVIRDGQECIIPSVDVVVGDIVKLEAGDFIPADARLIHSVNLKCDESILTGESLPSEKDARCEVLPNASIGDIGCMLFSGCSVVAGTALAVVVAIGMNTEIGSIADLLGQEDSVSTPLQERISVLGKYLGLASLVVCGIIFLVGVIYGMRLKDIFMISIALAVSAIPEGLPAIITIVLSIGVGRMAKQNAIIRRLPAVETLGSASVICSDKTGTLTQNRMTLVELYMDETKAMEEVSPNNTDSAKKLLQYATLCCDGAITIDNGVERHIGDPTETAIIKASMINGIDKDNLELASPRVGGIPFDSDRKLMTSINRIDGHNAVIVKGAFDVIKDRCIGGDLTSAKVRNDDMSSRALRVLAVAYKYVDDIDEVVEERMESELIFLGLLGMIDPPRSEVKDAVALCKKAGIKPVMITGDHIITANAIARDIGILGENDLSITGRELDEMSEDKFLEIVSDVSVYARVSPKNKIRVVEAWQKKGQVVAMTGDGVNDAPALKKADIGCAMGITGTDVSKNAADIVLTDDNFATIVHAVSEGRRIYDNIQKVVEYLIGSNIGEVLTVFVAMIFWGISPLGSLALLWINLITDGFPAIALGMTDASENIMFKKPKCRNENILGGQLVWRILFVGVAISLVTTIAFLIGRGHSIEGGRTLAFIALSLTQILDVFSIKSDKSVVNKGIFDNRYINLACLSSLMLMFVVLFTPLRGVFGLCKLKSIYYVEAVILSIVPTVLFEMLKKKRN